MKTVGSHLANVLADRSSMRRELAPFVRFLVFLAVVVAAYAWVFHRLMALEGQDHSWFTGVYWALTVMTTLGFGDITFHTDVGRAFSVLVLMSGVFMLLIVMPFMFVRAVYEPWVEQRQRARMKSVRRVPADERDHVLICANDPIALALARRLQLAGISAWIIEGDEAVALRLRDAGLKVLAGDLEDPDTYLAGRVDRARLVFANSRDQENSNIVLTVREQNPTVPIVALAESEDSIDVLELSGATACAAAQAAARRAPGQPRERRLRAHQRDRRRARPRSWRSSRWPPRPSKGGASGSWDCARSSGSPWWACGDTAS